MTPEERRVKKAEAGRVYREKFKDIPERLMQAASYLTQYAQEAAT